jgi:type I restriction enzyme S subunit
MPVNSSVPMLRWARLPECDQLVDGWKATPFTKAANVIAGQSPPSETYNDQGRGLPFLQGNADFSFKYPQASVWCSSPQKTATAGDTLISVRAPVGEVNRADREYAIGRGLAAVRATTCNPDFLFHGLQRWRWCLQRVAQGTTFDAVTARHFSQLHVAIPELQEEQAEIARILDAADSAIERTRASIESVVALRRALLQDLMPPWIGFRRLTDEQIPKGIEAVEIAKDVAEVCNGSTPSRVEGRYWRNGTIPWLPTGKVHDRVIVAADQFVTESALRECSINLLPRGTVLVGMIGQGRTRGMSAYLNIEACINQNFGAFVPRRKIFGKWLFYYCDFHYSRLREIGGGTNQGALNCYLLKRIRLPLPKLDRQKEVAAVLDAVEELGHCRQATLEQQVALKKSLMHDLLTGSVRVPNIRLEAMGAA